VSEICGSSFARREWSKFSSRLPELSAPDPYLSVVVPCFNEGPGLRELYRRLTATCREMGDFEIILVNDGSRDDTWNVMRELADRDPRVELINLSRNHGHQLALTAGLRFARGQRILIMDADLQDPPELLPEMMDLIDNGADVVFGQRRRRQGESPFKTLTAKLFYQLLRRMTDVDIPADTGDFRLMSRRSLDVLNSMPEQSRFIRGMVSWIGLKQVPLLYDREPRFAGQTKYPLLKMVRFAIDAISGFSIVPLRIASIAGAIIGVISFIMLSYTLGTWLFGQTVVGWTSLATILLSVSSVQLLVLGIMGEYLGRLYMQSKDRPLFIIDTVYRSPQWPTENETTERSGKAAE
jgi:glycosyltransferase involved in cell wall biosynthesis